jgi:RNA polymerase sigma-70 factor (ECF subfamily)
MKNNLFQLIEKCKEGDVSSKEWIYRKYAPVLLGICIRYMKNRAEAEDVLHEGFITIYEKIYQFEHKGSFEGWIKRIVVNKALHQIKLKTNELEIDEVNEPATIESEKADASSIKELITEADFSRDDILEIIQDLPDGFRTVFNLYVFENYQHKQIAAQLNISIGTSKSQLLRARKLIQKKLHEKVLSREPGNKKRMITYGALLIMDNKLKYIDTIAKSKLNGLAIEPTNPFSSFNNANQVVSTAAVKNTFISNIQTKALALASKKILWLSSAIIGTSVIAFIGLSKPNKITPLTIEPIVFINDSIELDWIDDELELIYWEPEKENGSENFIDQKTIVHKKKIPVKKYVTVKKPVIIRDTIKIVDTIEIK